MCIHMARGKQQKQEFVQPQRACSSAITGTPRLRIPVGSVAVAAAVSVVAPPAVGAAGVEGRVPSVPEI